MKSKPPLNFLFLAFYKEMQVEHHVFVVPDLSVLVAKEKFCQELENISHMIQLCRFSEE